MGLFRKKRYDRNRIMADAQKASKAGKPRKAALLYAEVLAAEPNNHELHRKLAPLFAQTRQPDAAWHSYKHTVEGLVRNKLFEEAVGVLREAAGYLPRQAGVWATLAGVELKRGRKAEAHEVLLEGRGHLRARKHLPQAIGLLQRAMQLRPDDFETGFDLADSFARSRQRGHATRMLERLARSARGGAQLRRVRARQFRLSPTPAAAWRWLRSTPENAGLRQPRAV